MWRRHARDLDVRRVVLNLFANVVADEDSGVALWWHVARAKKNPGRQQLIAEEIATNAVHAVVHAAATRADSPASAVTQYIP